MIINRGHETATFLAFPDSEKLCIRLTVRARYSALLTIKVVRFEIYDAEAASVLSLTSGFIAQAGFTHSLSPARNCTFACSYCYVPTMGIYGGLQPDDWKNWGRFTTFKSNAPELLRKSLRSHQVIYCSPLVDPYQPAEESAAIMPNLLDALIERPPRVFTLQTRGPLVLRDIGRLERLARLTTVRVSFSITTDREAVRRLYEPHCAPDCGTPRDCADPTGRRHPRVCHARSAIALRSGDAHRPGARCFGSRHHRRSAACPRCQEAWSDDA